MNNFTCRDLIIHYDLPQYIEREVRRQMRAQRITYNYTLKWFVARMEALTPVEKALLIHDDGQALTEFKKHHNIK